MKQLRFRYMSTGGITTPFPLRKRTYKPSDSLTATLCTLFPHMAGYFMQHNPDALILGDSPGKPFGPEPDILREFLFENNEEIEWIYFYLWHHEGRRARNGIAMIWPDYVQWHERFYIEMRPEAKHLLPGVSTDIMAREEHKWFSGQMTAEDREKVTSYYERRYGASE
jgi:hypothetical protein